MIKKDKCLKVKKQCRNVSKILLLELQVLFLVILYFHILPFLKPLSKLLKTFCITPITTVGNTMTSRPFWLPNSPMCSLLQAHEFLLPATKPVHIIKEDRPSSFSLIVKNSHSKIALSQSVHLKTTEIFHFSATLPLEDYLKRNNASTSSSCYIFEQNKEIAIHFSQKHRGDTFLQ